MPEQTSTGSLNIRDLPKDLRDRFKANCALQGKSMREVLVELMEQYNRTITKKLTRLAHEILDERAGK